MAFKMAPKSPLLMKAMGHASPAKQSVQGTDQTIQAEGKPEGPALTALQQAQQDADAAQVSNQVANIQRNTSGTKKETAKLKKRTARNNSATERKTKNAEKTQARVEEREKSGKTRVGKVVDKIKNAVSPAKQRTGGHRIKKKTLVKKLPELGNKNAEMGSDGKMTIITANMAKNQKPMKMMKLLKEKKQELAKVKSPAKQSKRTTRLKNKEAKETNKIIRGEKTSARKVNRLNNRLEVSKAKDKVKAVRKSQRAQKLEDKAAVLNNKAQG